MFRLRTKTDFDSAHHLVGYDGKCVRMHGHLWEVETFILGKELDDQGMVVDFGVIKAHVNDIVNKLDHQVLNEVMETDHPTSENVAKYIFEYLQEHMPVDDNVQLEKVRIWETPRSYAEYFEGDEF